MRTAEFTKHASDSNDYDFKWAIKLHRLTLSIAGIWPNAHGDASNRLSSDLRATFTLVIFIFLGTIPAIHSLVRTWGDMMATIDNLQFTLPLLTSILKVIVIRWKRSDLTLVLNMIADDWLKIKTNKERRVMIKCAQTARIIITFGHMIMGTGFVLLVILPCFGKTMRYTTNITDPNKLLPLQTHYIYDKDQSPYFELTFAAQGLIILLAAACYSGVDHLLGLFIFHLSGQMENLKERLTAMGGFPTFNDGLAFIVKKHIRLIKFFNIVESTFTILLLALLFYFGILFCLYGFLIVTIFAEGRKMSMLRLIYLVSVVLNICGHMFLYCVAGEMLVKRCEEINRAAYDYKWYILETGRAKALIPIMIRASKPLYITAGRIFPMTMSTFCNIIKTSGGYVSILLAKQEVKH